MYFDLPDIYYLYLFVFFYKFLK